MSFPRRPLLTLVLLAGACGTAGEPPEQPGESPRVVQAMPAPGAKGVTAAAPIVVAFDVAMDRAATERAFTSADLPTPWRFEWDAAGKTMTVRTPPLEYAAGDLAAAPRTYTFVLSRDAADTQGRPLARELQGSFHTLRRVSAELTTVPRLDGSVRSDGVGGGDAGACKAGDVRNQLCVGDSWQVPFFFKGFFTFDLSPLPDEIAVFEDARLRAYQYWIEYEPYDTLGAVHIERVRYDNLGEDAFNDGHDGQLGALSKNAQLGWKESELNLADAVDKDYRARAANMNRSQFRLRFNEARDGDNHGDTAQFYTGAVRDVDDPDKASKYPRLVVRFLAP